MLIVIWLYIYFRGYTILPYPITDQPIPTMTSEDTDVAAQAKSDTEPPVDNSRCHSCCYYLLYLSKCYFYCAVLLPDTSDQRYYGDLRCRRSHFLIQYGGLTKTSHLFVCVSRS